MITDSLLKHNYWWTSNRLPCRRAELDNVGPAYCRAEIYAGRVACCPWSVTASMPTVPCVEALRPPAKCFLQPLP